MGEMSWPFVGRDAEMVRAAATLTERRALVVAGEAGVGKSRFARELAERHFGTGTPLVVSASDSSREIPLGAFASILGPPDETSAELQGLRRALGELRRRGPHGLVLVDDAHLLDGVSATLIGQLAAERTVRLLLVVRSGEPAPDAVTALWKDGGVERTELAPLSEGAAARLLRTALGGPLHLPDERRLVEITRGNALWLRHLVEGERTAGRLTCVDGWWRWTGSGTLPPALRELVAARIGTLGPAQQRVLELVALAEPVGLGMLTGLAGDAAVEDVADRGLIVVEAEGARWNVRLGHPLYGEEVRARMSVPRIRRLRGELSAALVSTGSRRADDGLRRAVLDLGSDRRPDPEMLMAAALQANVLGDFFLAERLLRAACDAGGGFDARFALANLMSHFLRIEDADRELAHALDEATTDEQRVRAAVIHGTFQHFMLMRPDDALATLADTEARVEPAARAPLAAGRAAIAIATGDFAAARRHAETALADPDLIPHGATYAVWASAHVASQTGDIEGLRALVDRGLAAAALSPDTAPFQTNIGFAEVVAADLSGDPALARHRLDWSRRLTGAGAATIAAIYGGRSSLTAGRPHEAARLLEGVLPTFPGHGGGWGIWLHAMLARAHAMAGDRPAARRVLDRAEELRHPSTAALDWELDLARGWVCAMEGARRDAVRYLLDSAGHAQTREVAAVEVMLRQTAVRFGASGQIERLAALAARLDSPRARLAGAHASALGVSDVDGLLRCSGELEAAGMTLEAADAAAQAGALARDAGRVATAAAAVRRARDLAALGDAHTPAVDDADVPVALSGREREVATLVADGLSNKDIADRLHVSVRTVESHVYRACVRLGVPDRSALASVVGASGERSGLP